MKLRSGQKLWAFVVLAFGLILPWAFAEKVSLVAGEAIWPSPFDQKADWTVDMGFKVPDRATRMTPPGNSPILLLDAGGDGRGFSVVMIGKDLIVYQDANEGGDQFQIVDLSPFFGDVISIRLDVDFSGDGSDENPDFFEIMIFDGQEIFRFGRINLDSDQIVSAGGNPSSLGALADLLAGVGESGETGNPDLSVFKNFRDYLPGRSAAVGSDRLAGVAFIDEDAPAVMPSPHHWDFGPMPPVVEGAFRLSRVKVSPSIITPASASSLGVELENGAIQGGLQGVFYQLSEVGAGEPAPGFEDWLPLNWLEPGKFEIPSLPTHLLELGSYDLNLKIEFREGESLLMQPAMSAALDVVEESTDRGDRWFYPMVNVTEEGVLSWEDTSLSRGATPAYPTYHLEGSNDLDEWHYVAKVADARTGGDAITHTVDLLNGDYQFYRVGIEADFTGVSLAGVNWSGAVLPHASVSNLSAVGANLTDANFMGGQLQAAALRDAWTEGAVLDDLDLSGVDLGQTPNLVNAPATLELAQVGGAGELKVGKAIPEIAYQVVEEEFQSGIPGFGMLPLSPRCLMVLVDGSMTVANFNQLLSDTGTSLVGQLPIGEGLLFLKFPNDGSSMADRLAAVRAFPGVAMACVDSLLAGTALPSMGGEETLKIGINRKVTIPSETGVPCDISGFERIAREPVGPADWTSVWARPPRLNYFRESCQQGGPGDLFLDATGVPGERVWGLRQLRAPAMWNLNQYLLKNRLPPLRSHESILIGARFGPFGTMSDFLPLRPENWTGGIGQEGTPAEPAHGAHLASLIGSPFDAGTGVAGIHPDARIVGIDFRMIDGSLGASSFGQLLGATQRVLADRPSTKDDSGLRLITIAQGYHWAENGVDPEGSPEVQRLVRDQARLFADVLAEARGRSLDPLVITGAGNDSCRNGVTGEVHARWASPMAYAGLGEGQALDPGILVVEASMPNSAGETRRAYFSNFGGHLSAPGGSVYAAVGFDTQSEQPILRGLSGTSQAAALTSGVAAYMHALEPSLAAADLKDVLLGSSTRDLPAIVDESIGCVQTEAGANSLDAFDAVLGLDLKTGSRRVLTALSDIDDGSIDGADRQGSGIHQGDGGIDMADFRAWRDWRLLHLATVTGEHNHKLAGDLQLFGDLNFDGISETQYEQGLPIESFARGDLNGDGFLDFDPINPTAFEKGMVMVGAFGNSVRSDFGVLIEAFDDPFYAKQSLFSLRQSGDLRIDLKPLFQGTGGFSKVTLKVWNRDSSGEKGSLVAEFEVPRSHNEFIATVPSSQTGYFVEADYGAFGNEMISMCQRTENVENSSGQNWRFRSQFSQLDRLEPGEDVRVVVTAASLRNFVFPGAATNVSEFYPYLRLSGQFFQYGGTPQEMADSTRHFGSDSGLPVKLSADISAEHIGGYQGYPTALRGELSASGSWSSPQFDAESGFSLEDDQEYVALRWNLNASLNLENETGRGLNVQGRPIPWLTGRFECRGGAGIAVSRQARITISSPSGFQEGVEWGVWLSRDGEPVFRAGHDVETQGSVSFIGEPGIYSYTFLTKSNLGVGGVREDGIVPVVSFRAASWRPSMTIRVIDSDNESD